MISLWKIFSVFAKIGAFTIGGGIPMIAAIKSELVERKWLNDEDFIDIITLAQTAPGLFAVNISILTGHRLRGTKGSVVATIGSCLPPFLIILLVAMFFTSFKDNEYVIKAFKGIRPVVVALIGVPMIDMLKATKMNWWKWIVVISSMILVCFLSVSPIYILICVIVMAVFISWYNNKKQKEAGRSRCFSLARLPRPLELGLRIPRHDHLPLRQRSRSEHHRLLR